MGLLFRLISKFNGSLLDFSDRGFMLRETDSCGEPEKLVFASTMWIEKIGWDEGLRKNIVRCYSEGFSFWHGQVEDGKEWYCPYGSIVRFKQPFNISSASPIVVVRGEKGEVQCMLGVGADYIKSKVGGDS